MNTRDTMQAEILMLLNHLDVGALEDVLGTVRQKAGRDGQLACAECDLCAAAESCKLLLSMDRWERKGYLRWMKAKHPEIRAD
jgi:hypothetical protein